MMNLTTLSLSLSHSHICGAASYVRLSSHLWTDLARGGNTSLERERSHLNVSASLLFPLLFLWPRFKNSCYAVHFFVVVCRIRSRWIERERSPSK